MRREKLQLLFGGCQLLGALLIQGCVQLQQGRARLGDVLIAQIGQLRLHFARAQVYLAGQHHGQGQKILRQALQAPDFCRRSHQLALHDAHAQVGDARRDVGQLGLQAARLRDQPAARLLNLPGIHGNRFQLALQSQHLIRRAGHQVDGEKQAGDQCPDQQAQPDRPEFGQQEDGEGQRRQRPQDGQDIQDQASCIHGRLSCCPAAA